MEIQIHRIEITVATDPRFKHVHEKAWIVRIYWTNEQREKQVFENRVARAYSVASSLEFNYAIETTLQALKTYNKERLAMVVGGDKVKYVVELFKAETESSLIVKPGD